MSGRSAGKRRSARALLACGALAAGVAHAEMSAEELAKLSQNPVGNLISVPFQNNTNLNYGPEKATTYHDTPSPRRTAILRIR